MKLTETERVVLKDPDNAPTWIRVILRAETICERFVLPTVAFIVAVCIVLSWLALHYGVVVYSGS